MIRYKVNGVSTIAKLWAFPGGEVGAAVLPHGDPTKVVTLEVLASARDSDELMQLMMFLDAASRSFKRANIDLVLPYLPYARQDRVCNSGESLSIAVIGKMLEQFNLRTVTVLDPHSSVSLAVIKNIEVLSSTDIFAADVTANRIDTIVSPDAGAEKRAQELAKRVGISNVVVASKYRDPSNGQILGLELDQSALGKRICVIDDICDGGRTFIEVAKCMPNVEFKMLCVSHGIFSKGTRVVTECFDAVITTDSFAMTNIVDPKLTVKQTFFKGL